MRAVAKNRKAMIQEDAGAANPQTTAQHPVVLLKAVRLQLIHPTAALKKAKQRNLLRQSRLRQNLLPVHRKLSRRRNYPGKC